MLHLTFHIHYIIKKIYLIGILPHRKLSIDFKESIITKIQNQKL